MALAQPHERIGGRVQGTKIAGAWQSWPLARRGDVVSALTNLNRWYRYQQARIDGLINGLLTEARNLGRDDLEREVESLAAELRVELSRQMLDRRENLRSDVRLEAPEIRFDRL
jgi:hypothetical protein